VQILFRVTGTKKTLTVCRNVQMQQCLETKAERCSAGNTDVIVRWAQALHRCKRRELVAKHGGVINFKVNAQVQALQKRERRKVEAKLSGAANFEVVGAQVQTLQRREYPKVEAKGS
jgi:cell division inhibitor SulA